MEWLRRRLIWITLINAVSLACAEEDPLIIDGAAHEGEQPPEQPAGSDATLRHGSTEADVATQSEPLPPHTSDVAPAPDPSGARVDDGGTGGTSGTGGSSSESPLPNGTGGAGQDAAAEPTPPADPLPTDPPLALPDLVLDAGYLEGTIQQAVVDASVDSCLIDEKCITGMGLRRVVRFGTRSGNIGTADLVAGRPALDNPIWEYDACHDHFHFEGYAQYELIDTTTASVLPVGVKHGFCLRDQGSWDGSVPAERCGAYDCDYQGIGIGCYDVYVPELDCQWVDITDIAPGQYDLRVTINSERRIQELDHSNNSASVRILITAETVQVVH